ncbi:hypothetical protein FRC11_013511 [Ceratobasidium sp. 423]|nr:hypothetical protein FRC11_013511 [Ceratobasidium sp. 423]
MNPLASESFLTLPSFSQVDPTGVLPIAIGLIMFSNIELGRLSRPSRAPKPTPGNDSLAKSAPNNAASEEKALTELPRMSMIIGAFENGLRGVSILFIWIAMQAPGSVVLYWLTSALYTSLERLYFVKFGKQKLPVKGPQT